jgi:hypothetical protein
MIYRKDGEIASVNSKLESEQSLVAQLQKKIKELQVSSQTDETRGKKDIIIYSIVFYMMLRVSRYSVDLCFSPKMLLLRHQSPTRHVSCHFEALLHNLHLLFEILLKPVRELQLLAYYRCADCPE